VGVASVVLLGLTPAAGAATITVTTTADTVANDGQCSLREAITASETHGRSGSAPGECPAGTGSDTIMLGPHSYTLALTGPPDDANATGDLDITAGAITINGAGEAASTINATGIDRVIDVLAGASLTLQQLTITGGHAPDGGAGALGAPGSPGIGGAPGGPSLGGAGGGGAGGGGIRNAGTLVLQSVAVTGNRAGSGGVGGAAQNGGAGGGSPVGAGGAGGRSDGGNGGAGGAGGGVESTGGSVTIIDSSFSDDNSGDGGGGGAGGVGGFGANSNGNATGGAGGDCAGGTGGDGGAGGAIDIAGGTATITDTVVQHDVSGDGGAGATCPTGGEGGNGSGSGPGGRGGDTIGGSGGNGGAGGGVADTGGSVTISGTTINANHSGNGGAAPSGGIGGHGGLGSPGSPGSPGGAGADDLGGLGGNGGDGGGVASRSAGSATATIVLRGDTLAGNVAGNGAAGADATRGGYGGAGMGGAPQGTAGSSIGGIGGGGGLGSGAGLESGFVVADVTATGNQAGSGGNGGAGGAGPTFSDGGIGGNSGGGGIDAISGEGAVDHVTTVGNQPATAGAAGSAGTGASASAGLAGVVITGADLSTGSPGFGAPQISASASILGICSGLVGDGGGNITPPAATKTCPGNAVDPKLGPLADNGGPTQTMALLAGSPAIDLIAPPCGTTPDQRGVPRPQGAGCDAGAYEFAPPSVTTGPASHIRRTSATVSATIVPNARPTTWFIEYGPTAAYGNRTPLQSVAAGVAPDSVSVGLTGLPPHAAVHYRVVATNADGTRAGADAVLTTTSFAGITILSRKLTMDTSGKVSLLVGCPREVGSCKGTLTIKARRTKLGHAAFKLTAGARKHIAVKFGTRARKIVRAAGHKGLAVVLTAAARDAAGERATTIVGARLRAA
jgi:CSLREA domain-containing protein